MTILHVIAHPDDDLYFFVPDLADSIRSDQPTATVVMSAGQLNGAGATDGERARSRQRGLMDAYARMAGLTPVGDQSEWTADVWTLAVRQVDRYRLAGYEVTLLFPGLPDGQLDDLDAGATVTTVPATGGAGAPAQTYTRAQVVALLTGVVDSLAPIVVRALDLTPESRYQADHPDHVASARLVRDAVAASVSRPPVVSYRTYTIGYLPANLTPGVEADKRATAAVYEAYDPYAAVGAWAGRMRRRWTRGTQWLAQDAMGRLVCAVVDRGRLLVWVRESGGTWGWPVDLGNPGVDLVGGVAVGRNADGRLELFVRTVDHRIVHRWQTSSGGWSPSWGNLGNHNAGGANASQMGSPIVLVNADGRLQVAVKNGGGGVSSRWQTAVNNGWSSWGDLGGVDVQDGLAWAPSPDGRIELFAPTRAGILHWYQTSPNGAMVLNNSLPALPPSSELCSVRGGDGRIRVAHRTAGGALAVTAQTSPGNGWAQPVVSAPPPGYGLIAARTDGVFYAAGPDGVSIAVLGGAWASLGGPTGAVAVHGTELLALDTAGHPYHRSGTEWVPLP